MNYIYEHGHWTWRWWCRCRSEHIWWWSIKYGYFMLIAPCNIIIIVATATATENIHIEEMRITFVHKASISGLFELICERFKAALWLLLPSLLLLLFYLFLYHHRRRRCHRRRSHCACLFLIFGSRSVSSGWKIAKMFLIWFDMRSRVQIEFAIQVYWINQIQFF